MTITATRLTRAAGISAALAGLLFIGVQVNHPPMDVSSVTTTDWAVRSTAKALMAALALAGITGMYLRQVRQTGILGFIGYLLFAAGYLLMLSIEVVAATVLPSLVHTSPRYVNDVLAVAFGGTATHGIGAMQTVLVLSSVGYLAGGCMFGIALFRARVLARWAAALLAVGTVATVALAVLPQSFNRPLAVPTGVALIGLGISLWRDQPATVGDNPQPPRVEYASAR
ncbi:hypothetical protein RKE30_21610 [Streptomyces sp. Li-HN-5-11]|uniref:hypothetical protein n=1 Tax=Streptomyces sp. Li-HN-5-11 TaxID=3075432 RepID=UPI0028B20AD3|nr:hypothetical protein [Streptomyces sp. Li-HN-5-11]WNM32806.1 hypothetical protein RKE30_21610 [Streptomyces sp. Li-HN-5-11]